MSSVFTGKFAEQYTLVPGPNENVMMPRNEYSPADMQAMRRRE